MRKYKEKNIDAKKSITKLKAIKYITDNGNHCSEWTGAGLYVAIKKIVDSEKVEFTKGYLNKLLEQVTKY